MAGRHYYNTKQLVDFWKFYQELVESGITRNVVTRDFPVLLAELRNSALFLSGLGVNQFAQGYVYRDGNNPQGFQRMNIANGDAVMNMNSPEEIWNSLVGKMFLMLQAIVSSGKLLYTHFLNEQWRIQSEIWDYYKIHIFLDTFMYIKDGIPRAHSGFDFVFFNSNYFELKEFLRDRLISGIRLTIPEVDQFLKRQRVHNLRLSQHISLVEADVLNKHKELLRYDQLSGIVQLQEIPSSILSASQNKVHHELGFVKVDGCPFARTKGVRGNALVEVYEYFDDLFLALLEHAWEFQTLYAQPKARPSLQ
jgi:hypothetical protein